jgi:hypothetical protein
MMLNHRIRYLQIPLMVDSVSVHEGPSNEPLLTYYLMPIHQPQMKGPTRITRESDLQ